MSLKLGPGIGSLTQYLLEEAAEVMAFEIDKSIDSNFRRNDGTLR